ncbi:MAG: hypothetical protein ACFE7R_08670, partial [Candidatus Hodarchaeota archaeon]
MDSAPRISPVPSNTVFFAHEFVKKMRGRSDVRVKPSVRQTQAIPQILCARYFRNGGLSLDDFVDAAVRTTYPHDQEIARHVAEDIILGREKQPKKEEQMQVQAVPAEVVQNDQLEAVMQKIKREQELAKKINKDMVEAGYNYLQKLRNRSDSELFDAATQYLTEGDIVLRGLTSDDELREQASSELVEMMGSLSSQDIQNAKTLGTLDNVCKSPNAAESIAAKALGRDSNVLKAFENLTGRDPSTAARALRHIEDMGALSQAKRKKMDRQLEESIRDLSEAADYAGTLDRLPSGIQKHIKDAAIRFPLADSVEFAEKIKKHTESDLMDEILEEYNKQYDSGASQNVDFRQLAEASSKSRQWKDLL